MKQKKVKEILLKILNHQKERILIIIKRKAKEKIKQKKVQQEKSIRNTRSK